MRHDSSVLPAVKWPQREADHPLPSSAEIKNELSCLHSPIRPHDKVLQHGQIYIHILYPK